MTPMIDLPFLLAVETDPRQYHGEHARRPGTLSAQQAEPFLAHLATDLGNLFPDISQLTLTMTGALFDQTQLLQPGLPIFEAMESVTRKRLGQQDYAPTLVSIGTVDGHMPLEALQPDPNIPPGILLLVPCLLSGPAEAIHALEDAMEHRFMEEGQLSAHSAKGLETAFSVASTHARFMTLTDLMAMLKLQLEHYGFGGLWALLDAAMEMNDTPLLAQGSAAQQFRWEDGAVHARFETFDYWATQGAGSALAADELAQAYVAWTREYRQYLVTLRAHAVAIVQHLPDDRAALDGDFFVEEAAAASADSPASITEHTSDDLGLLAITVVQDDRVRHYYPLLPEGMNHILEHIFANGGARDGISFPGSICFDKAARRLSADCLPE